MTPTCRPCTYVCRFCSFVCRPRELKQGILLLKSCIFPDLGGKNSPPPRIIFRNGNIFFFKSDQLDQNDKSKYCLKLNVKNF